MEEMMTTMDYLLPEAEPTSQVSQKRMQAGLNYNDKWGKKTDVNASYIINDQSINAIRDVSRQNIVPDNNFNYLQNSNSTRENFQHRVNMSIDTKIDSFNSIKMTPSLTWQKSKTDTRSNYNSAKVSGKNLNSGYSNSIIDGSGLNFRNNILYRKRLAKKGRTFSTNLNMSYNESTSDGSLRSNNMFYDTATGIILQDSLLNQQIAQNAITRGFDGIVTYTEPLGKRSLIEASYFYNRRSGESIKNTNDYNNGSGKYDKLNSVLSNDFESNYNYSGGTINLRTQKTKWSYNYGASLQHSSMQSYVNNKSINITQQFIDVLPNAGILYKPNNYRNVRLQYNTSIRMPSATQLQPVPDVGDPLNIREGNPALRRESNHNVNINYFATDPATQKSFFAFASFSTTNSAIVYSDEIDPRTGIRKSRPVNTNGVYNLFGSANTGFLIRKLKSRIDMGSSFILSGNTSFINNNQNNIGIFLSIQILAGTLVSTIKLTFMQLQELGITRRSILIKNNKTIIIGNSNMV
jgi:outer membrane receptor protein involved in Fe transport